MSSFTSFPVDNPDGRPTAVRTLPGLPPDQDIPEAIESGAERLRITRERDAIVYEVDNGLSGREAEVLDRIAIRSTRRFKAPHVPCPDCRLAHHDELTGSGRIDLCRSHGGNLPALAPDPSPAPDDPEIPEATMEPKVKTKALNLNLINLFLTIVVFGVMYWSSSPGPISMIAAFICFHTLDIYGLTSRIKRLEDAV